MGPIPEAEIYRLTPGEAKYVQIVSGQPFNHLAVSDDGRFFIVDDYHTQTIHIGSVETGRFLKLCDSHARQGQAVPTAFLGKLAPPENEKPEPQS